MERRSRSKVKVINPEGLLREPNIEDLQALYDVLVSLDRETLKTRPSKDEPPTSQPQEE
jgi:hypothetical protein